MKPQIRITSNRSNKAFEKKSKLLDETISLYDSALKQVSKATSIEEKMRKIGAVKQARMQREVNSLNHQAFALAKKAATVKAKALKIII